jgi:hypothetical protein
MCAVNSENKSSRKAPSDFSPLLKAPHARLLSSDAKRILNAKPAPRPPEPGRAPGQQKRMLVRQIPTAPAAPGIPANVLVNNPADDVAFGNQTTQSEPSLAVSGTNIVVGFNDSTPDASLSGYSNSADTGANFHDDGGIAGQQSGDAVLTTDTAGNFYYAMLSTDANGDSNIGVSKSTDGGVTFTAPTDASTTANGPAPLFQDKEWIAVDTTGGANAGNLYVSWTKFTQNDAQILFARSTDGGATFSPPVALSTPGSVQGSMPAVGPNGEVYVVWFDGGGPQLMIRRSDDGGVTFSNPVAAGGAVTALTPLPDTVNGDIRANSFPSIAVDSGNGTVYVAYPQSNGDALADVFLVSSADNGQTWSNPQLVNDDGTATDQWMPSVAVASNGVVGVMFYDRRNDQANTNIDVYLALSSDGGVTFQPNQRITTTSFPPAVNFDPGIAANYMGDYNQIVASGTNFYMAWGDNRDMVGARNDPNVYFAAMPSQ